MHSFSDRFDTKYFIPKKILNLNPLEPCFSICFAEDIPEVVMENCAKCTKAQKHILKRFLEEIKVKKPDDYQVFKQKYDPQDKNFAALEAAIANS